MVICLNVLKSGLNYKKPNLMTYAPKCISVVGLVATLTSMSNAGMLSSV